MEATEVKIRCSCGRMVYMLRPAHVEGKSHQVVQKFCEAGHLVTKRFLTEISRFTYLEVE